MSSGNSDKIIVEVLAILLIALICMFVGNVLAPYASSPQIFVSAAKSGEPCNPSTYSDYKFFLGTSFLFGAIGLVIAICMLVIGVREHVGSIVVLSCLILAFSVLAITTAPQVYMAIAKALKICEEYSWGSITTVIKPRFAM